MRRPGAARPVGPKPEKHAGPGARRDRLARRLAFVSVVCLGAAFLLARDTQFFMPGPLASVHGAIENCNACHTKSGSGKLSWIHGLVAGDSLADSKACLSCHKMPDTAFNAHGASAELLERSTKQLTKIAAETPAPQSARIQNSAFPTHDVVARDLYCATCHQEHKGVHVNLNKISNEQCRSCHVLKFDSFDGHHPKFDNYPFKRRTRIIYDHAEHFGKHFPEIAEKDPAKRIPDTCSSCHDSRKDRRVMAVAPFERTCTGCHLDQIVGKERVSGPKGIAFLCLPGLDLKTLRERNASIGEWPEASEAELTPFMKMIISRNVQGRALIDTVNRLNLQDLTGASDDQIKAVTALVWEIKDLFYALISGNPSDVLAELDIDGAKLSRDLVADLTASIPRDVVISAHQQWLPNLATEIANRRNISDENDASWSTELTAVEAAPSDTPSDEDNDEGEEPASGGESDVSETASITKLDPPICTLRIFGQCLASKETDSRAEAAKARAAQREATAEEAESSEAGGGGGEASSDEQLEEAEPQQAAEQSVVADVISDDEQAPLLDQKPREKAADETDDLLTPTNAELREIEAAANRAKAARSAADSDIASAELVNSIESDVDPEAWADTGGWYRQDYAIFYRPTGHKDKFIYSWLWLTGPQAPVGDSSPAAAIFDSLAGNDAQGSCTKCHSVDDLKSKGRLVNFSPLSAESKQGRFTNFIHEPHFQAVGIGERTGILENLGCLTCHNLEKGRPYLKSFEQGNPQNFVSNFGAVKKDLCQTCHTSSTSRQDCLLCHKYHLDGVITPIMETKIPTD
jgi:hypothetical protein